MLSVPQHKDILFLCPICIYEDDSGEDENVPKMRGRTGAQIGVHWSLLRFYFAEIISAVEHMHQ